MLSIIHSSTADKKLNSNIMSDTVGIIVFSWQEIMHTPVRHYRQEILYIFYSLILHTRISMHYGLLILKYKTADKKYCALVDMVVFWQKDYINTV